jgi:hypothetical protein
LLIIFLRLLRDLSHFEIFDRYFIEDTVFSMVKRFLLGVLVIALILGSFFIVNFEDDKSKEVFKESKAFAPIELRDSLIEGEFEKDLLTCEELSKSSPNLDCIYNAMRKALKGTSPVGVFDIVNNLIEKGNLYVGRECHVAGHKIGADWVLSGSNPMDAIKIEEIRCEGAFTHGVLDAWALEKPSLEEAGEMADICDYEVGQSYESSYKKVWCWDGLGHAAWVASGEDYLNSLERCALIDDASGRSYCVEGVFMEIYEPANYDRGRGLGKVVDELPKICEKHPMAWLPAGASEDPRQGCWQGAGYLFTRLVTWDLSPSEETELIKARVDRLVSFCKLMGDGKDVCLERLQMASAPNFRYNAAALNYACSLYKDPVFCLDGVKSEFKQISRDFDAELSLVKSEGERVDFRKVEWRKPPSLGVEGKISHSVLEQL